MWNAVNLRVVSNCAQLFMIKTAERATTAFGTNVQCRDTTHSWRFLMRAELFGVGMTSRVVLPAVGQQPSETATDPIAEFL